MTDHLLRILQRSAAGICAVALVALAARSALPRQTTTRSTSSQPTATRPYDPTTDYESRTIRAWPVRVNRRLLQAPGDLGDAVLTLLEHKLYDIARMVPEPALGHLRQVTIWVELDDDWPMACYHPSADWLRAHGYNPDKAGAVEIANARNFLSWTRHQPSAVLHELAHAYHHQVLKWDNALIRKCYERAVASKSYDSVLNYAGQTLRAYAMENDTEYFAELSESFFGTNDFYPFVRAEVKQHDPEMFQALKDLWGVKE